MTKALPLDQLDFLRSKGVCWIVSGSMQSGRAFNNPQRVPQAIRYYRALARQAERHPLRYRPDAAQPRFD